jgi:hypothetical protein
VHPPLRTRPGLVCEGANPRPGGAEGPAPSPPKARLKASRCGFLALEGDRGHSRPLPSDPGRHGDRRLLRRTGGVGHAVSSCVALVHSGVACPGETHRRYTFGDVSSERGTGAGCRGGCAGGRQHAGASSQGGNQDAIVFMSNAFCRGECVSFDLTPNASSLRAARAVRRNFGLHRGMFSVRDLRGISGATTQEP